MFKTRVKKRIDRIKQVRLLHIPHHTHPADLGIALQMKPRHKFGAERGEVRGTMREKTESKERVSEGCGRNGRMRKRRSQEKLLLELHDQTERIVQTANIDAGV